MQQCHPSLLSHYQNLTLYRTGPLKQSGMHHEIPAVFSLDDLHPGGALVQPYPASHGKCTTPVVYHCWAEQASPHDSVLYLGCGGLSLLPGIPPAFFLVVSSETSGQSSGLHGTCTLSRGCVSAIHPPHLPGTVAICARGSCHVLGP